MNFQKHAARNLSFFMFFMLFMVEAPSSQAPQKETIDGIRNFTKVGDEVGCAGATDPKALAEVARRGYKSVLNLREATETGVALEESKAAAEHAGLKYIHLPFNVAMPDSKVVDTFLATVADRSNQPVYIHCGSANRVGGMWMIKRVIQDGWAVDRARTEAEAIGLSSPQLIAFVGEFISKHR